jgi:pimeloyl-ACP methyl ester carboxylesterase
MSAIIVGGDIVHYEVLGRGRPAVLVHGWVGSWRYWIPTMQQLHLKYRVYAVDLFGFGDSAKNPEKYTLDYQLTLLMEFMTQLGLGKAALIRSWAGCLYCHGLCWETSRPGPTPADRQRAAVRYR